VIRKRDRQANTVRLRGRWIAVDPRNWTTRDDMTISVGVGDGGKQQQAALILQLLGLQKEALQIGMAEPKHLFNAAERFVQVTGIAKSAEAFFARPGATPPPAPPDPKLAEAQARLDLEKQNAAARIEADQARMAAELAAERAHMQMQFALKREQMQAEFALKREEMALEAELKREAAMAGAQGQTRVAETEMGGEVG
jgi:hypothetical protein